MTKLKFNTTVHNCNSLTKMKIVNGLIAKIRISFKQIYRDSNKYSDYHAFYKNHLTRNRKEGSFFITLNNGTLEFKNSTTPKVTKWFTDNLDTLIVSLINESS